MQTFDRRRRREGARRAEGGMAGGGRDGGRGRDGASRAQHVRLYRYKSRQARQDEYIAAYPSIHQINGTGRERGIC